MPYNILSPDGFAIRREKTYPTLDDAKAEFELWKKGYEQQGYYSSNRGRIPLDELEENCTLVEVD